METSIDEEHCVEDELQALVYDILPWRKVRESDARSVCGEKTLLFQLVLPAAVIRARQVCERHIIGGITGVS